MTKRLNGYDGGRCLKRLWWRDHEHVAEQKLGTHGHLTFIQCPICLHRDWLQMMITFKRVMVYRFRDCRLLTVTLIVFSTRRWFQVTLHKLLLVIYKLNKYALNRNLQYLQIAKIWPESRPDRRLIFGLESKTTTIDIF